MRNSLIRCLAPLLAGVALTAMQAADAAVVRLGAAEALTGPVAQYGISIRNGLELAVNEINAKGGINGDRLELTVEDDQAKKEEAINVFRQLIFRDKVLMIFG
ncbi:MAG: ABC transporter substrate-binding protein, partial [Burkholderiaceae bacterium]|nr:ABC transporter substrate-binding protein [Burkholderiaceae bacterium]